MSNTWTNESVAFNPLFKEDKLLGFAVVSKNYQYFYSSEIDYKQLLKEAKNVIVFNGYLLKDQLNDSEFSFTKHNFQSLYFQLNSTVKFQNIEDIIKEECYSIDLENTHYIINPEGSKQCVIAAYFMLQYYLKNYKRVNKDILKLDNTLLEKFSTRKTHILVDQCSLRTDLSLLQKRRWDLERKLFNKIGYPVQNAVAIKDPVLAQDDRVLSTLDKIKTYKTDIEYLEKYIDIKKVEISFDVTATATSRILCRDRKHDIGLFAPSNNFKKYFCCSNNQMFISADYNRQEAFILATVSKDEQLYEDIQNKDFYSRLARWVIKDTSKQTGKLIFYAVIYGSSVNSLAHSLNISEERAEAIINKIGKRYRKLFIWLRTFNEDHNFFGRKLHKNTVNAYIQSTAADLIRMKLIETIDYNPVLVLADNIIYCVTSDRVANSLNEILLSFSISPFKGLTTDPIASYSLDFTL